ncbi:hypothetical protein ACI7YT_12260 [Microbacterium sp. M]|uniref:hypothetical protein n=1 Tax=Microbacterium sp. M TaxID=3377125 RepID=UPI0038633D00
MASRPDLDYNREFIADIKSDMPKKQIMEKWSCSSGFVVARRERHGGPRMVRVSPAQKVESAIAADDAKVEPVEFVDDSHDPEKGSSYTRMAATAWGEDDWREFLRQKGTDPDSVVFNFGVTSNPGGGYWNKLNNVRPKTAGKDGTPAWPVIRQATPILLAVQEIPSRPARDGLSLSLKCADPQIGFRALSDGTYEEFHDWRAMDVFVEVCRLEQPESIVILGDFLDLPSQGKYVQEAGFARTTQMALDAGYIFLSMLRAVCPDAEIVLIEGNHDKRMQNFIEQNALAAFGLRRAGMPDEWPVMSLQSLLRLDELRVQYMDAYPAAAHWDDDTTRNIHGTRANSKGSTMSQYANDLPHINTWAGHTHRTEIVYKTVLGHRGEPIESYAANPGCLAKTDGTVPSVHGALHVDGSSARVVEDWQQGFGALLYDGKGQSWPQVYRIREGRTLYGGKLIAA